MSEEPPKTGSFEIVGPAEPECQAAVDHAYDLLNAKLSPLQMQLLRNFKIRFYKSDDPSKRGSEVDFEHSEITCNRDDAAMTLQESEDFLVAKEIIEPGDTTKLLPDIKDQPWSTLTSELIHEYGHVLDKLSGGPAYNRLGPGLSPTKYGNNPEKPWEAFAEAFRFYVLGGELSPEAKKGVEDMLSAGEAHD